MFVGNGAREVVLRYSGLDKGSIATHEAVGNAGRAGGDVGQRIKWMSYQMNLCKLVQVLMTFVTGRVKKHKLRTSRRGVQPWYFHRIFRSPGNPAT